METLFKSEFQVFIEKIRYSIKNYGVDIESIKAEKCDSYDGYYYNSDEYCVCGSEILPTDECFWCEHYDEYYPNDECNTVNIGHRKCLFSDGAVRLMDLYEFRNEYYDNDALSHNDLVIDHDGDVRRIDDVYYWESDNDYHEEPEPCNNEEYTRSYHDGTSRKQEFTKNPKFYIGFEIEKEDSSVKESIYIDEFESECPKWRKESDGSLDSNSGYELISPCYELKPNFIKKDILANKILVSHINADKSTSCGGHINISENGKTGLEFFECIKGYTPLFHALYHKRLNVNYSKGKSNRDLVLENEKFQSIKIHLDRVEFRIVSAVPNINTLFWRCELMDLICKHQTSDIKHAFFLFNTVFKKHLQKMYPNDNFQVLMDRIIKYTLEFEGITISK